jgi:predicted  nucleic acid-binding Zn-ribbon protein
MHSDLEALINLQRIDARINELSQEIEALPASLSQLEGTVKKSRESVEGLTKKLEAILAEKKTLEGAIADAKSRLDKSQDLLNSIKTNREYDAVHTQIENFKSVVSQGRTGKDDGGQ